MRHRWKPKCSCNVINVIATKKHQALASMQGSREKARVSITRGETGQRGVGKEFKGRIDKFSFPSRKPQNVETF